MATISRFTRDTEYDPLWEALNLPITEIETVLTGLETGQSNLYDEDVFSRQAFGTDISLSANFFPAGSISVTRRGDVASIDIAVRVGVVNHLNGTTWRKVGQIPSGFRPVNGTRKILARRTTETAGATIGTANVEIRTNGEIFMRHYTPANHPVDIIIEFSDTYVAAGDRPA